MTENITDLLRLERYPKREGAMYPHQKSNKASCCLLCSAPCSVCFNSKFYCLTMKLSRKFWAFCSTDFCNFLDKSQAICLENCINLSCKNSQNVLDQFHCRTIKFLVENSFWSAHSGRYPTKYHFFPFWLSFIVRFQKWHYF